MKILLFSDPNSSHTIRWARALAESGLEIFLLGLPHCKVLSYREYDNINIGTLGIDTSVMGRASGALSKVIYLKALPNLRKIINRFKPDILHAHYATSYGLLGALSGFHPYIISLWGTDIFDFPRRSFVHRKLLQRILTKGDKILSTSEVMAGEAQKYVGRDIEITPFGIDTRSLKSVKVESIFDKEDLVIGTVKTLEEHYGIEFLIKAFKILVDKYEHLPLKLLVVGGGSLEGKLKQLAEKLEIAGKVVFTGRVLYDEVVRYHNMLSVYVCVSNSESFGVSVLEASACEKPVVVSDVGGLPEVVRDGVTGLVVPPKDPVKTAEAIEKLIMDETLRLQMGKAGRVWVTECYNWDDSVKKMIRIYEEMVPKNSGFL